MGEGSSSGGEKPAATRMTDPRLLQTLVCPLTRQPLHYDRERQELVSRAARLAFPIRDGVPLLTLDAARHLDEAPSSGH